METAKQAQERALKILEEFAISPKILKILKKDERPTALPGYENRSDGRTYTHNKTKITSYYHATYCIHGTRWWQEITSIEVRQDFDEKKFKETLEEVIRVGKTIKKHWTKTK
jgi:hypothetical protein